MRKTSNQVVTLLCTLSIDCLSYTEEPENTKKELRVCKRAISVFNGIDKYIKRLVKIESIIEKNTKKGSKTCLDPLSVVAGMIY